MQEQAVLLAYRFRFVFTGFVAMAILMLCSALITITGSNTIFDARTHPAISTAAPDTYTSSPNVITDGASTFLQDSRVALLSVGRASYKTCLVITTTGASIGRSMAHGVGVIFSGMWHGIAFVGKGIGSGVMFTLRLPGKALGSITHTHAVNSFVRPADDTKTPVIDSQTSNAILAQYSAQQQQKIADQLAAQLSANQELGGSIISGDPNHGGYPANLDNAAQDTKIDSWGMYNRECVSYAAWKVYQTYGHMPYWGGVGNANQWVANAKVSGIATGSTPKAHSVAISMHGYYGHAMWVEAVKGDMIYVSQYNYDLHGHYSEMWINGSNLTYLYFK